MSARLAPKARYTIEALFYYFCVFVCFFFFIVLLFISLKCAASYSKGRCPEILAYLSPFTLMSLVVAVVIPVR